MLFEFLEQLRLDDIRVRAPNDTILLCGGRMSEKPEDKPTSLRDVFYKILEGAIPKDATLLRAEDAHAFAIKTAKYDDFLRFESDLAQVCELVLLFCESEGSFAELGSFCSLEEIRKRTLVVIEDQHFNATTSYIRLGPLQSLLNEDDSAVVTFNFSDLGSSDGSLEKVDPEKLKGLIRPKLDKRLVSIDTHTAMDPRKEGHIIKAIVGLCQEFGALQRDEVLLALQHLGVEMDQNQLDRFTFCATQLDWLKERRKGDRWLLLSNPALDKIAAQFLLAEEGPLPTNSSRRRVEILASWERADAERHSAILQTRGGPWAT